MYLENLVKSIVESSVRSDEQEGDGGDCAATVLMKLTLYFVKGHVFSGNSKGGIKTGSNHSNNKIP